VWSNALIMYAKDREGRGASFIKEVSGAYLPQEEQPQLLKGVSKVPSTSREWSYLEPQLPICSVSKHVFIMACW
jgi:hypothetical protein